MFAKALHTTIDQFRQHTEDPSVFLTDSIGTENGVIKRWPRWFARIWMWLRGVDSHPSSVLGKLEELICQVRDNALDKSWIEMEKLKALPEDIRGFCRRVNKNEQYPELKDQIVCINQIIYDMLEDSQNHSRLKF